MRQQRRQRERLQGIGRQAGTTLIELTVVLVLMAIVSATVVMATQGMIGSATRERICAQIASIDQSARRHAEQTEQVVRLTLKPSTGRITATTPDRADAPPLRSYQLPRAYAFENAWRLRRGEHSRQQELVLAYDARGSTSTWGVSLQPKNNQADTTALLVLGATGQSIILESDESLQDILAQISRRDDD